MKKKLTSLFGDGRSVVLNLLDGGRGTFIARRQALCKKITSMRALVREDDANCRKYAADTTI